MAPRPRVYDPVPKLCNWTIRSPRKTFLSSFPHLPIKLHQASLWAHRVSPPFLRYFRKSRRQRPRPSRSTALESHLRQRASLERRSVSRSARCKYLSFQERAFSGLLSYLNGQMQEGVTMPVSERYVFDAETRNHET